MYTIVYLTVDNIYVQGGDSWEQPKLPIVELERYPPRKDGSRITTVRVESKNPGRHTKLFVVKVVDELEVLGLNVGFHFDRFNELFLLMEAAKKELSPGKKAERYQSHTGG